MREDHIQLGKYRISPLTQQLPNGSSYKSSSSICVGAGNLSLDRIIRFVHRFASEQAAKTYAVKEGIGWVKDHHQYLRVW